jgi:hypothetical protein
MRRTTFLVLALMVAASMARAQVNFNFTGYTVAQPTAGSATSGDFNRDGKPDFAVVNGDSDRGFVTVFLATTAGHFPATGVGYPVPASPNMIRTADLNNDGKLDLVISFANRAGLSVLLGRGDGTFTAAADIPTTLTVGEFDLGDFNHDGDIDIAVIECDSSNVCDVRAELNNGNATFTPGYKIQMTGYAFALSARDLDGDGNLDLILIRTSDVLIFGGDANGRFPAFTKVTPPVYCTGVEGRTCTDLLTGLAVADFNNDGRLDFALMQAHRCGSSCDIVSLYTYKNNGSGFSFSRVADLETALDGGPLLAADLNGDGNIDLLNTNGMPSPYYVYLQGSGNSTFAAKTSNLPPPSAFGYPIARDLNLDSRRDVLLTEETENVEDNVLEVGLNTSAYTNCAPPSSANLAAKICTPGANATVSSPVLIRASANSPAGVARLEVWVDGVKRYQKWNDQLAKSLTLSSGSHRVVVVAVDVYKGIAKSTITINVP